MPFPVVQSPVFFPLAIDKKEAAMADDLFGDYGLGIHDNITGFPFDFSIDAGLDPMAVDPGLTLSPYGTTPPDSHFTTPQSVPLLSPGSSIEYFGDHRSSIGSIGSIDSTVAPYEASARPAVGGSRHNNKSQSSQPTTKTKPDTASTAATSASKATDTTATAASSAKPNTDAETNTNADTSTSTSSSSSTMMTRTRRAAAQTADAAPVEVQSRPNKRQKTAASSQSAKVKLEPQQQPLPPPKRKLARRGPAAKREDTAQRTKNLERNRIAASKCRQKKKEWVLELEETKQGMEIRHTNLRLEYLTLLDEVTRIKNQLMAHAACNDPNINFWIEKEALRYVERCMDPPAGAGAASGSAAASAAASAAGRRPSTALTEPAAAESCTLPSPSESQLSNLDESPPRHEGINLDYMPDEMLSGDAVL